MEIIKLDFSKYNGSADTPIGWYSVSRVTLMNSRHYKKWMATRDDIVLGFTETEEEGRTLCTNDFEGKVKACLIL